ncbi:hypothetical protein WP2W18E01_19860 [Aeromonas caviae]|uniref:Uncharacterized protein n=1 Tax=Aeromonas caviae TaxID=648 RepID=A0A6S4T5S1_AERCA|nr:hypothetical protein [Aeromonas caviae]BBQ30404.1 hypothetical protein WP2W18E01_19860 [Aeromonas caviae]
MSKPITPPPGLPLTLEQANELIYKLMARIAELEESYGDFWCMGDIEKVAYPAD